MSITYKDAVKAQAELEEHILADPNVVSVGVIAEINALGEPTGDYVIKVGVISAEEYLNSVSRGDSLIPREYLLHQGEESQEMICVRIQVVTTGKVKPLSLLRPNTTEKNDFPNAVDTAIANVLEVKDCAYHVLPYASSGSCSFKQITRKSGGLLFVGHDSETLRNPINLVLPSVFGEHKNKYPSGKVPTFPSDYPLQILQKRSYSTSNVPNFSVKNAAFVRNLRAPATKYGAAIAGVVVAAMGISCCFFKAKPPSQAHTGNNSSNCVPSPVPIKRKGWFKGW